MMPDKWDTRFFELMYLVASWSKDPGTKCGAVIVRPDRTVASVGFNGFPKGCSDRRELYEAREEKLQRVIHAEVNAVLHARERLDGYTMYAFPPCDRCATVIIQSGIKLVKHPLVTGELAQRWGPMLQRARTMLTEAGVPVITYDTESAHANQ